MAKRTPEAEVIANLSLLRVAKLLFTSDWYEEASETLFDNAEKLGILRWVGEDTHEQWRLTQDLIQEWSRDAEVGKTGEAARVAHTARVDFLRTLVETKEDAWRAYEQAALTSPPQFRDRLMALARMDLKHASRLTAMLHEEMENPADDEAFQGP